MSTKWNSTKPGTKTWVHSAAALTAGHVVYNIKYLGNVEVSAPKGADIIKEAVTKLKFNKQVKRSEGTKPPKKELTISVDGVTIQDRQNKEKEKEFSYPLHHISYCADDKSDKKICAFIAKDVKENKHVCHVMESDKNAEEITLTVGQAFDLAYQKFLASANKSQEQQQQNDTLRKRVSNSPARSPQMGRVYLHGSFMGESPPGTPPSVHTTRRTHTPPKGGTCTPPRAATPPYATIPPSVSSNEASRPPQEDQLPPPPPSMVGRAALTSVMYHPPPPSPPPPPSSPPPNSNPPPLSQQNPPVQESTHPSSETMDDSVTYLSPIPAVRPVDAGPPPALIDEAPKSEGPPPYDRPPPYDELPGNYSNEILQTRL